MTPDSTRQLHSVRQGKDFQVSGPLVWLAGDIHHTDFAPAVAWLWSRTVVHELPSIDAPPDDPARQFPAAIVLCQSRPGQISQAAVESLHARAPLARLVALVGCWCEGEVRSGHPWHGVKRIYWHQALARLPEELGITERPPGASHRPRTENGIDAILRALPAGTRMPPQAGLVAITTSSRDTYAALADICWAQGLRSVWQMPGWPSQSRGADAVIVDGWPAAPLETPKRTILLVNFLRPTNLQRAAHEEVAAVLGMPLFVPDLTQAIESLVGRPAGRGSIGAAA
jgi:hypothetical protein